MYMRSLYDIIVEYEVYATPLWVLLIPVVSVLSTYYRRGHAQYTGYIIVIQINMFLLVERIEEQVLTPWMQQCSSDIEREKTIAERIEELSHNPTSCRIIGNVIVNSAITELQQQQLKQPK